ncbi:UvrD-helicase domain-containing protein [Nocardia sp. NPDC052566]|uniref:UvrD-helicase domain-containing protein n=1 Tax=Nocardia sp. NPDC052566 TaxID=3364330 RepID=UPI0037C55C15
MTDIRRERRRHRALKTLAALPDLTSEHRNFLSVPLVERGWRLLVHPRIPHTPRGHADAILVGEHGLFALVFAGAIPPVIELNRIRGNLEGVLAGLRFRQGSPVSQRIRVALLVSESTRRQADGRFEIIGIGRFQRLLMEAEQQFSPEQVRAVIGQVISRTDYMPLVVPDSDAAEIGVTQGLFEKSEVLGGQRAATLARPLETWRIYLDPDQRALVNRTFNGCARINGPAGTGKSLIALHRMVRYARQRPGRLLFLTHVRSLAACMQNDFHRLAPEVGERAEFTSLHAYARRLLKQRGIEFHPASTTQTETAFRRAWARRTTSFEQWHPDRGYWQDEIHRVIKGNGLTELAEYQRNRRIARHRLDREQLSRVWHELYLPYQEYMSESGDLDFNDVIAVALDSVRATPIEQPYGLVVVDEAQDLTLNSIRLAHSIAGGGSAAPLLVVDDFQQQMYPGGWRLRDAGIDVVGRSVTLRVNYRNRANIHRYAVEAGAVNAVDGTEGVPAVPLSDADAILPGGRIEVEHGADAHLIEALVRAIHHCGAALSDIAVLTRTNRTCDRLSAALNAAGIATMPLDKFDGSHHEAVKVGTVHRAKGLNFLAVFRFVDADDDQPHHRHVALTRARDYLWEGFVDQEGTPSGT